MFGLGPAEIVVLVGLIAVIITLQWAVGYALLRWTPLGRGIAWRGKLATWFIGMIVWMVVAGLRQFLFLASYVLRAFMTGDA